MDFTLYGTVSSTSSNANNLIYYAASFDSFNGADYVIFNDAQYSYYIVWGDLEKSNGVVGGSDVYFIHYYRTDTSGYTGTYEYESGNFTDFNLKLDSEYLTVSNIPEVGFISLVSEQLDFYENNVEFQLDLFVLAVSILFAIMLCNFRRTDR